MKYSLNWIKEHLGEELSEINTVVREVTLRAFEVEEVTEKGDDTILEIKVLPDRAHDALSHRGMAREIGALLGVARKNRERADQPRSGVTPPVRVVVEDSKLCPRYVATRIDNVNVGPTQREIAEKLESVGGRSINNIVDITNYVLFDIGQPLHAFDAEKVVGGITVRLAKKGETMTTLDNKSLTFLGRELVIADDEGVIALAGIKGGKKAEVTSTTTCIILESANFDPTLTRKTSEIHKIKTDASKRYENGMTSAFAMEGCALALTLLKLHGGELVQIGESTDVYPTPEKPVSVRIGSVDVNRLLGLTLTPLDLTEVLTRAGFGYDEDGEQVVVAIPEERLDLRIKEDMIEEIGRHVGYENVESALPRLPKKGLPNKRLHYSNRVRTFLTHRGYLEVFTYSFAKPSAENDMLEVLNPVGDDRPYLRRSLHLGIRQTLSSGNYNAPLLGLEKIAVFEFGNVFRKEGEKMFFALGAYVPNRKAAKQLKSERESLLTDLFMSLGVENPTGVSDSSPLTGLTNEPDIWECDFDQVIEKLPEPTAYEPVASEERTLRYKTLSMFPFIVRDIAVFVPQEVTEEYIEGLLQKEAGDLLVRISQFDKFQKEGEKRISYGFRMVFQSFERTLTDEEVAAIMEGIMIMCHKEKDWQVR